MNVLKEGDINIEEVENIIFDGGLVALCTMKLMDPASSKMLEEIRLNKDVLTVSHTALS
jgi:D-3-phosphoglycerate dehydrogenase